MRCTASTVHLLSFLTFLAARGNAFLFPVAVSAIMAGEPPLPPPTAPGAKDERPPGAPPLPLQTAGVAASSAAGEIGATAETEGGESDSPSHLVVLAHGLAGTAADLTYLKQSLERAGGVDILVHSARCNQERTKDGVAEGGARLAKEIIALVDSTPSLSRISLVGNSLGGLYVRYAAKLLYSTGDAGGAGGGATIAGLKPSVFMTIATPHLGVRRFTYVPLPSLLHPLAGVFVGKTGNDLFLSRKSAAAADSNSRSGGGGGIGHNTGTARDGRDSVLLYSMGTSEEFLRPLRAFRRRRAYANRRGDFMVPYETAAFLEPDEGDGSDAPVAGGGGGTEVGTGGAAAGRAAVAASAPAVLAGAGSFTLADRLLGAKNGAIVGFSRVAPAAPGTAAVASGGRGERVQSSAASTGAAAGRRKDRGRRNMEEEMAAGLNSCGWEKVSVDFGSLAPFSHNKICALSRTRITTALYGCGKSVVDHAADFLVAQDIRGTDIGDENHN